VTSCVVSFDWDRETCAWFTNSPPWYAIIPQSG
jgi:hypothetical protein